MSLSREVDLKMGKCAYYQYYSHALFPSTVPLSFSTKSVWENPSARALLGFTQDV